ncbi:phage tail sheath subtilisin-like domain-containing protein [Streptomyces sp. NPDC049577]|uniref:phage tail sheath family protein n=1 Tax=Streptomyces sp. NPDC049577 TaxID=3155153 RepID=UPI003423A250
MTSEKRVMAPGVFVQEVAGGVRMIEGAATSTPAFLGSLPGGPEDPVLVRDRAAFDAAFPEKGPSTTRDCVNGHFANGGGPCYVVNVAPPDADADNLDLQSALAALESHSDVHVIAVPDLWSVPEAAPDIAQQVADHCVAMGNRVALLHTPEGLSVGEAAAVPERLGLGDRAREFTAVYYPWVRVPGPGDTPTCAPPVGHVAGAWARTDAGRGVHKAPANESLVGTLGLERELSEKELTTLTEASVNVLRAFPQRTPTVWGASTLSRDPHMRHLNVRRYVNFLRDSIVQSTGWAVFEPNNEQLWDAMRTAVEGFLTEQWQAGALHGRTAEEAFYVTCDRTNNSTDRGDVIASIGVAPMRPAEFVRFDVSQAAGQAEEL